MNNLLLNLSRIFIFLTVALLVSNMQAYVLSLRIGILPGHIFLAVIAGNLFFAFFLGNLKHINKLTLSFLLWYGSFLLYCAASLILIDNGKPAVEAMNIITLQAAISITFVLAVQRRELIKVAGYAVAVATVAAAGVSILEFINPDFNMINDRIFESKQDVGKIGRSGGIHANPNGNARALVMGLFVSQFFLPKPIRLLFALFIGAAVFTTVSRSGIMLWVLAIAGSFFLGAYATGKVIPKVLGLGMAAGLSILLISGQLPQLLEETGLDEYMNVRMIERLSGSFTDADSGSNQGRLELASEAFTIYASAPFFGAGLGTSEALGTESLGAHNMFLKFGAELGTVGILIFLGIILVAAKSGSRISWVFCALFLFSSLFTHNNLEKASQVLLLPLGLFLCAMYLNEAVQRGGKRRRRRKKIAR